VPGHSPASGRSGSRVLRVTECAYQWHSGSAAQAPGPGQPEPQALAQTGGMKLGPGGRHARSAIQAGSLDSAPKADVPLARLWPATQWHSQPDSGSPSRSWHSRTPEAGNNLRLVSCHREGLYPPTRAAAPRS
jgi:hypothetical protein